MIVLSLLIRGVISRIIPASIYSIFSYFIASSDSPLNTIGILSPIKILAVAPCSVVMLRIS